MDHIGIDVHKRDSQIYLLAEGGEVIEQRIRTEAERFAAVLGSRPRARILIEASIESEWVARCLETLGHEVIVADPNCAPMYATRSRTVKTDRRDARALAEACLLGAYRPAHRLSDAQRHVRAGCWSATPWSGRARATSPSSEPCSASRASARRPAARSILSTAFRPCPCQAACPRSSPRCSPSCVPSRWVGERDDVAWLLSQGRCEDGPAPSPRIPSCAGGLTELAPDEREYKADGTSRDRPHCHRLAVNETDLNSGGRTRVAT